MAGMQFIHLCRLPRFCQSATKSIRENGR
jgi:hypothetical protein